MSRESESLMEGCRKVVMEVFDMCKQRSINDWGSIKTEIRDATQRICMERNQTESYDFADLSLRLR